LTFDRPSVGYNSDLGRGRILSASLFSEPAIGFGVAEELRYGHPDVRKLRDTPCSYRHSLKMDRPSVGYSDFTMPTMSHSPVRSLGAIVGLSCVSNTYPEDFSVSKCTKFLNHGTLIKILRCHSKIVLWHHPAWKASEGCSELLSAYLSYKTNVSLEVVKVMSNVRTDHNICTDLCRCERMHW
jgi:hypothetical protein